MKNFNLAEKCRVALQPSLLHKTGREFTNKKTENK